MVGDYHQYWRNQDLNRLSTLRKVYLGIDYLTEVITICTTLHNENKYKHLKRNKLKQCSPYEKAHKSKKTHIRQTTQNTPNYMNHN